MKILICSGLVALLLAPVISLSGCSSSVIVTVSNDTRVDMVVKVIVNSQAESSVDCGRLTPGQSAAKRLAESWFGISTVSVEGIDDAGRVMYHRDYTVIEAKRLNGVFKINEQPAYFTIV